MPVCHTAHTRHGNASSFYARCCSDISGQLHALSAPEGQWVGRKPVVVNRPGFLRPADLSKRRELFTNYTLQTARRIESFAASDSDLVDCRV